MDTFRRSKWPRNSVHSLSVGTRYPSPGRCARRRARKARCAWIAVPLRFLPDPLLSHHHVADRSKGGSRRAQD